MSLIHAFMPRPLLRQVDRVAVAADAERAWRAVRNVDLYRLPFVRALFTLRGIPERLREWRDGHATHPMSRHAYIDDITFPGNGFQILAESGDSIVVGAIGKLWHPNIEFVRVEPSAFADFRTPGYGKVVWSLSVFPRPGGAWISVDLRVDCTDEAATSEFSRYWRLIGPFSHVIRRRLLASLTRELGRAGSRVLRRLETDALLPEARIQRTHAICVDAPPARLWPWLVQMGCHRGGWYTYDLLDNGGFPSADQVEPELQALRPGDQIPAQTNGSACFTVLRIEPERLLVLGSPSLVSGLAHDGSFLRTTWSFVLEPIGDDATHLIVRVRATYEPSATHTLAALGLGLAHEIMERKQLRTLKTRAERAQYVTTQ